MISQSAVWKKLQQYAERMREKSLRELFNEDKERFGKLSAEACGVRMDFSKQLVDEEMLELLMELAREVDVEGWRSRMFGGEKINFTEKRAVGHVALRMRESEEFVVDGVNVVPMVHQVLTQMGAFSDRVRSGEWVGYTGKRIRHVVNLGIGGSDLGPVMVSEALKPYWHEEITLYFVSNVDGTHIAEVLKHISAEETLFIVASKSFTTQETMMNAGTAREWFLGQGGSEADIAKHFVALSTNRVGVEAFGIDPVNCFEFWDWVGGRYSVWSAIGLSVMLAIGKERFGEFLAGARAMDEHFVAADLRGNLPVLLGMLSVLNNNFYGFTTKAILPYDQYLHRFAAYFQQGDMESLGKFVNREGERVDHETGAIIWGEPGTNGQHAFMQLIHQGTRIVPSDFIIAAKSHNPIGEHQRILMANFLAQTEALAFGKTEEEVRAEGVTGELVKHRAFEGNRPSTSILVEKMTPMILGSLVAMYEHAIFVQGMVWGINPYDQYGVELGKVLAKRIEQELEGNERIASHDSSTNGLVGWYQEWR